MFKIAQFYNSAIVNIQLKVLSLSTCLLKQLGKVWDEAVLCLTAGAAVIHSDWSRQLPPAHCSLSIHSQHTCPMLTFNSVSDTFNECVLYTWNVQGEDCAEPHPHKEQQVLFFYRLQRIWKKHKSTVGIELLQDDSPPCWTYFLKDLDFQNWKKNETNQNKFCKWQKYLSSGKRQAHGLHIQMRLKPSMIFSVIKKEIT